MPRLSRILAVAAVVSAAAPATAHERAQRSTQTYTYGSGTNALRVMIGGDSLSVDDCFEDVNGDIICDRRVFFARSAFMLGVDYDLPLGGGANLTLGGRLAPEPFFGSGLRMEPLLDFTWKFTGLPAPIVPRLRAGLGVHVDSAGVGPALRLGGGLTFFPAGSVGIALDLMVEAGTYRGFGFSSSQFMIGPEFRL